MCQAMNHDLCGTESHDDRTELDRLNYEQDMANLYAEGWYEQSFIPLLCEDCGRIYDDAFLTRCDNCQREAEAAWKVQTLAVA